MDMKYSFVVFEYLVKISLRIISFLSLVVLPSNGVLIAISNIVPFENLLKSNIMGLCGNSLEIISGNP